MAGVKRTLRADDDVVDGNVDELDEETNEAHDGESDGGGHRDLLVLLPVGFGAALHQPDRVLGELTQRIHVQIHLVHFEPIKPAKNTEK